MNGAEACNGNKRMNIDEAVKAFGKLHILHAKQTVNLKKISGKSTKTDR